MDQWPELPLADWADTCATLQLWTQVVGKIRLAHAPLINHWWQVALYVTASWADHIGDPLRRALLPDRFRLHRPWLVIQTSDGATESIRPRRSQRWPTSTPR